MTIEQGQHENSLANLTGWKEGKERYHTVSQEIIDKLFMTLAEDGVGLKDAAAKVGITFDTAKKYFEKGDKNRGIKPLRSRLVIYRQKISETFDRELIKRKRKLVSLVRSTIDAMEDQIKNGDLLKKASIGQLDRLIRLEIYLSGLGKRVEEQTLISAEEIKSLEHSESYDIEEKNG